MEMVMDRRKVAAHFAAFVCFLNQPRDEAVNPSEAGRFARENWQAFLPYADDRLAELLTARPGCYIENPAPSSPYRPGEAGKASKRQPAKTGGHNARRTSPAGRVSWGCGGRLS
jgi:hypothetical protein